MVTGRASGGGCFTLDPVRRVSVAVARRSGARCRFLNARGRPARRLRACSRRAYLRATGTERWRLTVPVRAGRHVVQVRVLDAAGRRSRLIIARAG